MKAIGTVLFAACLLAAVAIAFLLVPEHARGDRFWLSTSAILVSLFLCYLSFVLMRPMGGEQGQEVLRFQSTTGSMLYLLATIGLAGLAMTGISFQWLAVLHILALLMWILLVGLGALGSQAMKSADELHK